MDSIKEIAKKAYSQASGKMAKVPEYYRLSEDYRDAISLLQVADKLINHCITMDDSNYSESIYISAKANDIFSKFLGN